MDIFLVSTVAAFFPIFVYIVILRWLDRYEPEPISHIFLVFFLGAFFSCALSFTANTVVHVLASFIMTGSGSEYFTAAVLAPVVEEINKGLAVLVIAFATREFDNLTDGILYGAVAGLGFAFVENIYYFMSVYSDSGVFAWMENIYTRGLYSASVHACASAIFGASVGYTRYFHRADRFLTRFIGLVLAIMVHSFWNSLLTVAELSGDVVLSWLPFLGIPCIFVMLFTLMQFSLYHESQVIERELTEEAKTGLLPLSHVNSLKSYFARARAKYYDGKFPATEYVELMTDIAFRRNQCRIASDKDRVLLEQELAVLRNRVRTIVEATQKPSVLSNQNGGAIVSLVVMVGIASFFLMAIILKDHYWTKTLADFPATKTAELFLRNHPQIAERLGKIEHMVPRSDEGFYYNKKAGEGTVDFRIKGDKAVGTASVRLFNQRGYAWLVQESRLRIAWDEIPLETPESWVTAAEEALSQENPDEAKRYCARITKAAPEDFLGRYCDARILEYDGRIKESDALILSVADANPAYYFPQIWAARVAEFNGDLDGALRYYLKAWDADPSSSLAAEIASLQVDLNRPKDALKWLKKSEKSKPTSSELSYAYGKYYLNQKDVKLAKEHFQRARELDPANSEADYALATLYQAENDKFKTVFYYEQGLAAAPTDSFQERKELVEILLKNKWYDSATYHLMKTISYHPYDVESFVKLAAIYTKFNRTEDAAYILEKALKTNPEKTKELMSQGDAAISQD